MDTSIWFNDIPVIGAVSPDVATTKFHEIGKFDAAETLDPLNVHLLHSVFYTL
jgi:hypothetical protein